MPAINNVTPEPLCYFPQLKSLLTGMGIEVGKAESWRTIGTINVLPEDIGRRILFENGGIYYLDDNGIRRRGFMYKKSFYFQWRGQANTPKFHACQCEAIDIYGQDEYRFANDEPIKVFSKNDNREVEVEGMQLCGYCRKMLLHDERFISTSTDFVKILKEAGEVQPSDVELDFYGYVKNWEAISLAYRTKRDFTCERCRLHIDDLFDRQFMHTHHRNGDKTDNREANLECLCIKCHSEVDARHVRNFSHRAKQVLIAEFRRKYGGRR